MADEAVRAPALGGVTERLDAQDDAHGADDDDVPITRSEGTKHGSTTRISKVNFARSLLNDPAGGERQATKTIPLRTTAPGMAKSQRNTASGNTIWQARYSKYE
jgi:hypothetical protein